MDLSDLQIKQVEDKASIFWGEIAPFVPVNHVLTIFFIGFSRRISHAKLTGTSATEFSKTTLSAW